MPIRSRRDLLAGASATLAGLSGCLDASVSGDESTTTSTGSSTPDSSGTDGGSGDGGTRAGVGTRHDVDGRTVRLESVRTSRAIVTLLAGTHPSVSAEADRQYVVVELTVSGEDPRESARRACEVGVDDVVAGPVSEVVQPFTDGVHLAFSLPLDLDPGTVTLAWVGDGGTATWGVPESVSASLAAPPAFEVRSFDVPARADGDEVAVSFAVANVGETDGTFLAELGTRALSDQGEIRVPVNAGETVTETQAVGLVPSGGDQSVVLDWGADSIERTVAVQTTTE